MVRPSATDSVSRSGGGFSRVHAVAVEAHFLLRRALLDEALDRGQALAIELGQGGSERDDEVRPGRAAVPESQSQHLDPGAVVGEQLVRSSDVGGGAELEDDGQWSGSSSAVRSSPARR